MYFISSLVAASIILIFVNGREQSKYHNNPSPEYTWASILKEQGGKDCVYLDDFLMITHLRYYFGCNKIYNANRVLLHFYHKAPLPNDYIDGVCPVMVPIDYLEPNYSCWERNASNCPEKWLSFMAWLLEVKDSEQGQGLWYNNFKVIKISPKEILSICDFDSFSRNRFSGNIV